MNFISYKSAVSLYPNTTFINRRSYLLPFARHSWQAIPSVLFYESCFSRRPQVDLKLCSRRIFKGHRDLGVCVARNMSDQWSWIISFDLQGAVIGDPTFDEVDEDLYYLWRTQWVVKLFHNIPKAHTTSLAVESFGPYP